MRLPSTDPILITLEGVLLLSAAFSNNGRQYLVRKNTDCKSRDTDTDRGIYIYIKNRDIRTPFDLIVFGCTLTLRARTLSHAESGNVSRGSPIII